MAAKRAPPKTAPASAHDAHSRPQHPHNPPPPRPRRHTYTRAIADLDAGHLPGWAATKAPPIAIKYWRLPEGAMLRDVLLAVRADEAIHRDANHVFGSLPNNAQNPFARG